MKNNFTSSGAIRQRKGESHGARFFFTVEKKIAEEIKKSIIDYPRRGRGSVKVKARIGRYSWTTSIFPDKKSGCYLLPIKKDIRNELNLKEGSEISCFLEIIH